MTPLPCKQLSLPQLWPPKQQKQKAAEKAAKEQAKRDELLTELA